MLIQRNEFSTASTTPYTSSSTMIMMMRQSIGSRNLSSGSSGSNEPLSLREWNGSAQHALAYSSSRELLEMYCHMDEVRSGSGGLPLPEKTVPLDDEGSVDFMEVAVSKRTSASEACLSASLEALGFDVSVANVEPLLDDTDPFAGIFEETEDPMFDFSESPPPDGRPALERATTETVSSNDPPMTVSSSNNVKRRPVRKLKRKRHASKKEPQNETEFYTDFDVLLGRGGLINHHPGNKAYLQEKSRLQQRYLMASRTTKTSISLELVDWVHARGGRFMEKMGDEWYEVEKKRARAKASQTLREI